MFATHGDPHDIVSACTCLSALQSAASVFYLKLATGQTAAKWGRTPTTATTQQRTEHTNHSATEAANLTFLNFAGGTWIARAGIGLPGLAGIGH